MQSCYSFTALAACETVSAVQDGSADSQGILHINVSFPEQPAADPSASEMTYIVSGGALNSTHSLLQTRGCCRHP